MKDMCLRRALMDTEAVEVHKGQPADAQKVILIHK